MSNTTVIISFLGPVALCPPVSDWSQDQLDQLYRRDKEVKVLPFRTRAAVKDGHKLVLKHKNLYFTVNKKGFTLCEKPTHDHVLEVKIAPTFIPFDKFIQ